MRAAVKYTMEDIQMAITRVITHFPSPGIDQAIGRLAFMAEFPAKFSVSLAGDVFLQACSLSSTPSANDLKPLMTHPALVAAMIKNRESKLRNQLQQSSRAVETLQQENWGYYAVPETVPRSPSPSPPMVPEPRTEGWLQEELVSLGFSA